MNTDSNRHSRSEAAESVPVADLRRFTNFDLKQAIFCECDGATDLAVLQGHWSGHGASTFTVLNIESNSGAICGRFHYFEGAVVLSVSIAVVGGDILQDNWCGRRCNVEALLGRPQR